MRIRGFGRNLNLVLASHFLAYLAYSGLYWLLSNLYLLRLGYSVRFFGVINAIGFLVYALASYPAGHLVPRWGLKRSLVLGAVLSTLFLVGFPLVESFPRGVRPLLFALTMLIGGMGYAMYFACIAPAAMEAPPERRATALSVSFIASLAGGSLGNLGAGLLVDPLSRLLGVSEGSPVPFRFGLMLTAVVQLGVVACVASLRPAGSAPARAPGDAPAAGASPVPRALLAVLVSMGFLGSLLGFAVGNFFNVDLDQTFHVPAQSIGIAGAVVKAAPLVGYILAPALVRKLGAYSTALLSMIAACLAAASIGLASVWLAAASGYALMSLLSAFGSPASSFLYQSAVPADARPVVAGAQNAAGGLASAVTLLAGGFVITVLGYGRFFLLGLALNAVSIAIFAAYVAAPRRRSAAAAA